MFWNNRKETVIEEFENCTPPIYWEETTSLERQIDFLYSVCDKPYPVHWFMEKPERTKAMYLREYEKWEKAFQKESIAYLKLKAEYDLYTREGISTEDVVYP